MSQSILDDLYEKLRKNALGTQADAEQEGRARVRESTVQLREPGSPRSTSPASTTTPSFKVGDVPKFPFASERLPETPGAGNLSNAGQAEVFSALRDAASRQDPASRDAATDRAAQAVSKDWARQHGHTPTSDEARRGLLQESRAQAVFIAREVGAKVGLDPVSSSVVGYSLERALEKEGFKVFASHALDKASDLFKATASSVTAATGNRQAMEETFSKSMNWLASHGVTKDALKGVLTQHMGKLVVIAELAQHPEVFQKTAQILAKSDKAIDGILAVSRDDDLRKAVGTVTLAAGEGVAFLHKGVGAVGILAGSALRGDSASETGRHAFRAALSVAGGALGGIGAGAFSAGFGSIGGAVLGSHLGAKLADTVLAKYDEHINGGAPPEQTRVANSEVTQSMGVIGAKMGDSAREVLKEGQTLLPSQGKEKVSEFQREMSMGKGKGLSGA